MRFASICGAALLMAACDGGDAPADAVTPAAFGLGEGQWEAGTRSGLCSARGADAAFILYAEDDSNCMAQGRIGEVEGDLVFVPQGDEQCQIPLAREGDTLTFGDGGEACRYYCGGTAEYVGMELTRASDPSYELVDAAGDSIC